MNYVETHVDPVSVALKHLHDTAAAETVPKDFLRILNEIDAKIADSKTTQ